MTRKEAEYTVELMVEDYCKGFTHKMNDEFVEALMVIMNSDFKTVDKFVSKDVKSFDIKGNAFLNDTLSCDNDSLIWIKANGGNV